MLSGVLADLYIRLRALFRRGAVETELDDELRFHFERQVDSYVESGVDREEAVRRAQVVFGGLDQVREECREARGVHLIETSVQDLKYGVRMLRKNPGFTLIAITTLAVGIGATTAIFSCVNTALLRPLPYRDANRLAIVWESSEKLHKDHNVVAPPNYFDWLKANTVFEDMTALGDVRSNLTGAGDPEQIVLQAVTTNFFSVLGVTPIYGRGFVPEEGQPGKDDVVVLSYSLWKARFGGDPRIVGKSIELNGHSELVVGIAPKEFGFFIKEGSLTGEAPQVWSPFVFPDSSREHAKTGRYLTVAARLKPGVTFERAQAEMALIADRLAKQYPDSDAHWGANVVPIRRQLSGQVRPALLILFGAVCFVLLIACANVSSLLLARASAREKEMAIRTALGAGRWRIARQLLIETVLLAGVGGLCGVGLAFWGTRALLAAGPKTLLGVDTVPVDFRVLGFAGATILLSGVLLGILPSYLLAHSATISGLKEGGRGSSAGSRGRALRRAFVVVQVALALVLLAGSGLMVRSFIRLIDVNPGFESNGLLTFKLGLPLAKYGSDQSRIAFFHEFLDSLRHLNGVESVTTDSFPPFSGTGAATGVQIVGQPVQPASEQPVADVRVVGPDYFRTMGIPVITGRSSFSDEELAEPRGVVVVNRAFADRYLRGANPVGQKLVIYMRNENPPSEVIGEVGDVRQNSLDQPARPTVYWPYPELAYSQMTAIVKTSSDPLSILPAVRSLVQQTDRNLPIARAATMDQVLSDSVARSRFAMLLLALFAVIAFVLAAVGIYGVIAYNVTRRTNEIGVRLALGARRSDVMRLVLVEGAGLTIAGVGIGLAGAIGLTRLMASLLYGVSPTDPITFISVSVLLAIVAIVASYVPARRAMMVDPVVALRYE